MIESFRNYIRYKDVFYSYKICLQESGLEFLTKVVVQIFDGCTFVDGGEGWSSSPAFSWSWSSHRKFAVQLTINRKDYVIIRVVI